MRNAHGKETNNGSIFPACAWQIRANEPKPNPNPNPKPKSRSLTLTLNEAYAHGVLAFHIALFAVRAHGEYN